MLSALELADLMQLTGKAPIQSQVQLHIYFQYDKVPLGW